MSNAKRVILELCAVWILAGCTTAKDSATDHDQMKIQSYLEDRWSPELIERACVPETRFNPAHHWEQVYWIDVGTKPWQGALHPEHPGLGKVWWYATVTNGRADAISINVIKGRDHWHLETIRGDKLPEKPLQTAAIDLWRASYSIRNALDAYRWAKLPETKGSQEEQQQWALRSAIFYQDFFISEKLEYAESDNSPIAYLRHSSNFVDQIDYALNVSLGSSDGLPTAFSLNGQKDSYLENLYSAFQTNYTDWLDLFAYNCAPKGQQEMSWVAHLEALGLSPGEVAEQRLLRMPQIHQEVQPACEQRVAQPDYTAWGKVTPGMTEHEVLRLLGKPFRRGGRDVIGGYEWSYGVVVPKSMVFPEPYEFSIGFSLGRVSYKQEPFTGNFSSNGIPSVPQLIVPRDGASFSHYPRFVDLRWTPSSGVYPLRYEVDIDFALAKTNTTIPYVSARASGRNRVTWRVRAINEIGTSGWSEERAFSFER